MSRSSQGWAAWSLPILKASTWMTCTCVSNDPWCARADALFDVAGMHVLAVERDRSDRLVLTVETDADVGGCPECGVVAVGHGRRVHQVADAPCFGVSTVVRWRKRVFRCAEPACAVRTFSEQHELIRPRAKLTSRAIGWATDALADDDTTVSALPRHLGVDWHTCWDAVEVEAAARVADPGPAGRGADPPRGRAHLAPVPDRGQGPGGDRDARPAPRRARKTARTAAGRRPGPVRDRVRRLADKPPPTLESEEPA